MKRTTTKRTISRGMNPLAIATIGATFSPFAYSDRDTGRTLTTVPTAQLASHEFLPLPDGRMAHVIDGRERAIVPPEGLAEYARAWPQCAALAKALGAADR
jgi:hypothetical protein